LINIVLFGETGIGKTTIINAFANHITYNSYKDVIESKECVYLADTKFLYQPMYGEEITVTVGQPEERDSVYSDTKSCRSYLLTIIEDGIEYKIRLIDTPGFLHTEENSKTAKRDDEFIKLVIDQLSVHEYIDAYLLLLAPNSARFSENFAYCVERMLIELDCKADKNLLFGYTKCKNDLTAASTRALLKKMNLNPKVCKNEFFFENSPSCALAALHNDYQPSIEQSDLEKLWEQSLDQYANLVSTIIDLPCHDFKGTITIQKVRQKIKAILPYLLECKIAINFTLEKIRIAKQNNQRIYTNIKCVFNGLDSRKTVCKNIDCSTVEVTTSGNIKTAKKKHKVCCDNCGLIFNLHTAYILHYFFDCKIMKSSICTVCVHGPSEHESVLYEIWYQEEICPIEEAEERENFLRDARKQMMKCFSNVHCFLKENSFLMKDNPLIEKIKQEIKRENEKEEPDTGRRTHLTTIKSELESAVASKDSTPVLTADQIDTELENLATIPEYGDNMKTLFDFINKKAAIVKDEKDFIVPHLPTLSIEKGLKKLTIKESEG